MLKDRSARKRLNPLFLASYSISETFMRRSGIGIQVGMEDKRIAALQMENQKLRRQNELLLEALASTGHEWRNLLSRLHLIATRLEHPTETSIEQRRMLVGQIAATTEQLQRIAELYLVLAQIETDTLVLQPRFLDPLRDLIEPVLDRNRASLADSCQTVQLPVERGLVVWADDALMLSAYETLIRSALLAGQPGGRIVLDLAEESDSTLLTVEVSGTIV